MTDQKWYVLNLLTLIFTFNFVMCGIMNNTPINFLFVVLGVVSIFYTLDRIRREPTTTKFEKPVTSRPETPRPRRISSGSETEG